MRKSIIIAGSGGQGIRGVGETIAQALDKEGYPVSLKVGYGAARFL